MNVDRHCCAVVKDYRTRYEDEYKTERRRKGEEKGKKQNANINILKIGYETKRFAQYVMGIIVPGIMLRPLPGGGYSLFALDCNVVKSVDWAEGGSPKEAPRCIAVPLAGPLSQKGRGTRGVR